MRMTRQSMAMIVMAAAAAAFCSGCPALMLPGLAYSGYQYEHNQNQPAPGASNQQNGKSSSQQPNNPPDTSIE